MRTFIQCLTLATAAALLLSGCAKKDDSKKANGEKAAAATTDDAKKTDGKKTDGKKTDGKKDDGKKTDGKKDDGKKDDGKKDDGKKTDAEKAANELWDSAFGEHEAVGAMNDFADEICACKDAKCLTDAMPKFQELTKKYGDEKINQADSDKIKAATEKIKKCVTELPAKLGK